MSYFSKNLTYLREKRKLSKYELATKLNVNSSTVSRWEKEEMGVTVDKAYDIAEFFSVSIADLTGKDLTKENNSSPPKEIDQLEQYKVLFDKDDKLTDVQKEFILDTIREQHRKIDEEIEKGNVN